PRDADERPPSPRVAQVLHGSRLRGERTSIHQAVVAGQDGKGRKGAPFGGRMCGMPARTAAGLRVFAFTARASGALTLSGAGIAARPRSNQAPPAAVPDASSPRAIVDQYCVSCHSARLKTAGLDLASFDFASVGAQAETWEKVIAKLRA